MNESLWRPIRWDKACLGRIACRIRRPRPDIPIVGQTAHALVEDLTKGLAAGMSDRIVKPLVLDDVVRSVSRSVKAKAQRLSGGVELRQR